MFALNEGQQRLAEASRSDLAERGGRPVHTAVETAGPFYPAEGYHQKYLLRRARALFDELRSNYASETEMLASTPAARINGYLGCNGYLADLEREIGSFGLTAPGREQLLAYVKSSCKGAAGATCPAPQ